MTADSAKPPSVAYSVGSVSRHSIGHSLTSVRATAHGVGIR